MSMKPPKPKKNGAYPLVCNVCGKKFEATDQRQRYCSPECYDAKDYEYQRTDIEVVALRSTAKVAASLGSGAFHIYARDGFKCVYCGRGSIEHGVVLHADHIYPRSKGGADTAENLITACMGCNLSKSARVLDEDTRTALVARARRLNAENGIPHLSVYAIDKYQ